MHTGVWRKAPVPSCRAPGDGAPPPPAFLSPIHAESAGARKFAELHCGCRRGCAGAPAGTPRRRSPRHRGAHLSTSPGRPERACPGGKVTVTLKSWTPSSKNFSPVRLARRPGAWVSPRRGGDTPRGRCAPLLPPASCPQVPRALAAAAADGLRSLGCSREGTRRGARSPRHPRQVPAGEGREGAREKPGAGRRVLSSASPLCKRAEVGGRAWRAVTHT